MICWLEIFYQPSYQLEESWEYLWANNIA